MHHTPPVQLDDQRRIACMEDAEKMNEQVFPYTLLKLVHQVNNEHWIQIEIKAR
jgi:hypothetical protein